MQSSKLPIATLVAFLSFPAAACVAQEATTTTDATTTAPATAESLAIIERYMVSVPTELTSKVDTRNAAVGQQVTAKTTQAAKLADGTALPSGTKLIGHVTQVRASSQDQSFAALTITFDRAELKGGQSVVLRSVIRTVAPPASVRPIAADSAMADQQMPFNSGTSAGSMGPGATRGGLGTGGGGGVGGGPVRGVGQTTGGIGQTTGGIGQTTGGIDQTTGGIDQTAGGIDQTAGGIGRTRMGDVTANARTMTQATANTPGGVVTQAGETVSVAPRATALPGVMLATSGSANASGTLVSGRNISLDSGTRITLGLITR